MVLHTHGIAISLAVEDLSILTKGRLVRWRVHPAVVGVRLIRLLQRALEADDLARRLLMLGAATASVRRRRELQPLVMCFEMPARHEQACDSIADRRAELFVDPERTCNSIFGNVTAAIIASRATAARMRSSRRARRRWRGSGPAGGPVLVSVLK